MMNEMETQDSISQPLGAPPAYLFDLDGTLVDTVYLHVLAWHEALEKAGKRLPVWGKFHVSIRNSRSINSLFY